MENTESLDADVILPGAEFRRMQERMAKLESVVDYWESAIGLASDALINQSDIGKALDYFDTYRAKVRTLFPWPFAEREVLSRRQRWEAKHGADRDRLAAENARLREAVDYLLARGLDHDDFVLVHRHDWRYARSLTEAQP